MKVLGNDKPWFTRNLKIKLKRKKEAFSAATVHRTRKPSTMSTEQYGHKILTKGASLKASSFRTIPALSGRVSSALLAISKSSNSGFNFATPDNFNNFHARFDRQNPTPISVNLPNPVVPLPLPFSVQEHRGVKLFKQQSNRTPAGSDYPHTEILIPVPKKPKVKALNDFRPVALTSVVMKVLERLVLMHEKSGTNSSMDPLQFAYGETQCTDGAIALALHFVMQQLESPGRYARILFVDYNSAISKVKASPTVTRRIDMLSTFLYSDHWLLK